MQSLPEHVRSKIRVNDITGCWEWMGYRDANGYGTSKHTASSGPTRAAHRIVYRILRGPIVNQLDHLCRVRHCVNPDHLEDVTQQVNCSRAPNRNAAKTHCKQGHEFAVHGQPYIKRMPDGREYTARRCVLCVNESSRKAARKNKEKAS